MPGASKGPPDSVPLRRPSQVSLSDVLEDTLAASKHKNPAIKTEAIRFLARCLAETRAMPAKGDLKPIAEALMGAMDDSSPDVRDAGAQGLGTLMKLIGERPMNQFIDALDDIKKGKVQDQFKVATVKVKTSKPVPAAPPRAAAAASTSAASKPRLAPPKVRFFELNLQSFKADPSHSSCRSPLQRTRKTCLPPEAKQERQVPHVAHRRGR